MSQKKDLLNYLIQLYNYQSYLEIGVRDFRNFSEIKCSHKHKESIDPEPTEKNGYQVTYRTTSDRAFEQIRAKQSKYDLIFIDGLHLENQVDRDIQNSLACLNDQGTILLHDCNPPTEFHQRENYEVDGQYPAWNGTVWKSIAKLRMTRPDLYVVVVDTDWGCGLIQKSSQLQPLFWLPSIDLSMLMKTNFQGFLNWQLLEQYRVSLLNLISLDQFYQLFH